MSEHAADLALVGALVELIEAVVQNTTRHSLQAILLLLNVPPYQDLDIIAALALVKIVKVPLRLAEVWGLGRSRRSRRSRRLGRLWRLWSQQAFSIFVSREEMTE